MNPSILQRNPPLRSFIKIIFYIWTFSSPPALLALNVIPNLRSNILPNFGDEITSPSYSAIYPIDSN